MSVIWSTLLGLVIVVAIAFVLGCMIGCEDFDSDICSRIGRAAWMLLILFIVLAISHGVGNEILH